MRVFRCIPVVLAIVLSSCGGATDDKASVRTPPVTPSATPSAMPSGSTDSTTNPVPTESGSVPALPQRPCEPKTSYSPSSGVPGQTYIRAITRPTRTWGRGCEVLSPGDRCVVGWDGAYILMVGHEAHLTFQAWAKGQSKPFKELTAGPLPPEHKLRRVGFPVEIPDGVEEVAFRVVLLDSTKTPVAISDAFTYTLNCRPEAS